MQEEIINILNNKDKAEEFRNKLFMPWEFIQFSVNKGSNLYGKVNSCICFRNF